jgi:hypothetical protein
MRCQVLNAGGEGDAAEVDPAALVHSYGRAFVQGAPELALEYYMQARPARQGRAELQGPCACDVQGDMWPNCSGACIVMRMLLGRLSACSTGRLSFRPLRRMCLCGQACWHPV